MGARAILFCAALGVWGSAAAAAEGAPQPYEIDRSHTSIAFTVDHFGFSTTHGLFNRFEIQAAFDPQAPAKTTIDLTIDPASITTGWPERDDELRGERFFNVAKFPAVTFKSKKVEITSEKTARLTGDLTLLGITKPITLDVTLQRRGPHFYRKNVDVVGFTGSGKLKRSDFGMATLVAEGLGDEIMIAVSTEFSNAPARPKN